MSFILKTKNVPIPSEEETKRKFLTIGHQIGCYNEVLLLLRKYDNYALEHKDYSSREALAGNLLQDLSDLDLKLVAWLFDENNEVRVNNKVILKLVSDGKD